MKVVVIGAGHGGLQAAKTLAEHGVSVTVYEKSAYETVSYDWSDDVEYTVFEDLHIPLPEGYYHTDVTTLVAPYSDKCITLDAPYEKRDRNIERRAFVQLLADRAATAGAKVEFGTEVKSLLLHKDKVCGVVTAQGKVKADLVIDASGVNSPFRASLPKKYCVEPQPLSNESFGVYRVYLSRAEGAKDPEFPKRIHLLLNGKPGISWCFCPPDGTVNLLVGVTGNLTEDVLQEQLKTLKELNPVAGNNILRGDVFGRIPIRYPLSRMVGDGYAAVGDSAYMTIPMIGSGISNSLRAGQMLAETVLQSGKTDTASLWNYQVRYYTEIGAEHVLVDIIKRALLSADSMDIRYVFESGILSQEDMKILTATDEGSLSPFAVLKKVWLCLKRPTLVRTFGGAAVRGVKALLIAKNIPVTYRKRAVKKWQKKLDGCFGK